MVTQSHFLANKNFFPPFESLLNFKYKVVYKPAVSNNKFQFLRKLFISSFYLAQKNKSSFLNKKTYNVKQLERRFLKLKSLFNRKDLNKPSIKFFKRLNFLFFRFSSRKSIDLFLKNALSKKDPNKLYSEHYSKRFLKRFEHELTFLRKIPFIYNPGNSREIINTRPFKNSKNHKSKLNNFINVDVSSSIFQDNTLLYFFKKIFCFNEFSNFKIFLKISYFFTYNSLKSMFFTQNTNIIPCNQNFSLRSTKLIYFSKLNYLFRANITP
jgi:hypothetical protein